MPTRRRESITRAERRQQRRKTTMKVSGTRIRQLTTILKKSTRSA